MNQHSILIVDDCPANFFLAKKAITASRPGDTVVHADSGIAALELLKNGNPPALILLDCHMPGLSGVEVLQEIRKRPETRYCPVVMLSSSDFEPDIKSAYDAGANSFLTKARQFDVFTEEINAALHYWLDVNKLPPANHVF